MPDDDALFPLLPHLDAVRIRACYDAAPGNEVASGKFASAESSAALAANAWGYFVSAPEALPLLPGCVEAWWPARSVTLEAIERFPWAGGRHPCLDARVLTDAAIVGVESKRFEPYRSHSPADLSEAYWRPVWGERMRGYCAVRDLIKSEPKHFRRLDAAQLVKHAFGLRTTALRENKSAVLLYVYAEPRHWANGDLVEADLIEMHRREVAEFAAMVEGDEVVFAATSYSELLHAWLSSSGVAVHAQAVLVHFKP